MCSTDSTVYGARRHAPHEVRRHHAQPEARALTCRSPTVVVARRQARRHRAVRTLRAVALALALPSATLPFYLSIYLSLSLSLSLM